MTDTVTFSAPLAYGENYPVPAFSMLPSVKRAAAPRPRPIPANVATTVLTTRARYGLAMVAKAGIPQGSTVLLPAYHCPSMVEPFLWAGFRVSFYKMKPDLSPDPAWFGERMGTVRAVVLVRYFGFDGQIASFVSLAREQGCLVIEDLAHAPFIRELYGDFGVTSLMKLFPLSAGAEIWSAREEDGEAVSGCLQHYRRSPSRWHLGSALGSLQRKVMAHRCKHTGREDQFRYFSEKGLSAPLPLRVVRQIARQNEEEVILTRRTNYGILNSLLMNSPLGAPLFPKLGPTDVPYVFPFVLRDPQVFDSLREAGIPLYRWEELAPTACGVSQSYRSTLIQIPCHQDLSETDFELIGAAVRSPRRLQQAPAPPGATR
jgi:perosamine synthetase